MCHRGAAILAPGGGAVKGWLPAMATLMGDLAYDTGGFVSGKGTVVDSY